jgi:hypothetical protein
LLRRNPGRSVREAEGRRDGRRENAERIVTGKVLPVNVGNVFRRRL